jgi:hypothetical protein
MTLFKNQTHQDIWIGHHCERCFHYADSECPILSKALRTNRKPPQWDRSTRKNALMQDTIKCNEETHQPPRTGVKRVVNEDVPMFDVQAPTNIDPDHA